MKARINQRKAGALLSYLNLALGCIIPLLYTPIMLSILGQEEYGLYSLSNSVISYLGLLSFGMSSAIVRYTARYRAEGRTEDVRGLIGLFLLIYGCLAALMCIVGVFLTHHADIYFAEGLSFQEIKRLKSLMLIMTVSSAVALLFSVFVSMVSAYEEFVFSRSYAVLWTILTPVVNLIILYSGYASIGIAMGALIIQVLNGVVYVLFCIKRLNLYPRFSNMPMQLLKEIWVFSAFVFLSSIVDMLYWATDKVLIGAFIGSAAVAVYNVGGVFTSMLQSMSQSISNVFTPKVMMLARKNSDISEVSALLIRIGRLQFYIVSFLLSGYIVFGQKFIMLWAGAGYQDAYYIALLTMIPLAIPLIQSIAYSSIVARNKHQFRAVVYAVIAVVNVVATYFVIPKYGIIGAAACTAIAFIVGNGIIMNLYYSRAIGLDIAGFWKNISRISIVPVLMIAGGYFIVNHLWKGFGMIPFLMGVCLYSVIFWGMSWACSMNEYEKGLVRSLMAKVNRMVAGVKRIGKI